MSLTSKVIAFSGVLMLLGVSLVGGTLASYFVNALSDVSIERLEHLQENVAGMLRGEVMSARRDVAFLAASPSLRGHSINQQHVEEVFKALLQNTAAYSQIRFIGIDDNGRELVRVERRGDEIQRVRDGNLQSKASRDYFRQALALPPGEIYVSAIDLNREHGNIVVPHLAVLRIAMPVRPGLGPAEVSGIVIINIDVEKLFTEARASLPHDYDLYITNNHGDYLVHPDASKTFGFDLGRAYRVQDEFADASALFTNGSHTIRIIRAEEDRQAGQIVSLARSNLVPGTRGNEIVLGISAPLTEVNAIANKLVSHSLLITGIVASTGLLLIAFLIWHLMRPLRDITRAVSNYDGGTWERTGTLDGSDEFGALAGHFEAMTERLDHQFRELNDQRGRLDSLVEAAVDAIVLINEDGIIERCNKAIEPLFGYSPQELLGQNVKVLMSGMHHENHDQYLERYLRTGKGEIIGIGREVSGRRKDGEEIPLYLSIGEFTGSNGRQFTGILHDISDRKRLEAELHTIANTDPLTGAHNRRYFVDQAELELNRAQRYQHPLSLMILDLDFFKQVNDQYGHAAGDAALKTVVDICRQMLREQDTLCRLGGDEFAVLLPETDLAGATLVAERATEAIAGAVVPGTDEELQLSISIGVTALDPDSDAEFQTFMSAADAALYEAKTHGRGRVQAA